MPCGSSRPSRNSAAPPASSLTICPLLGTEISSLPSGVQAASRAFGTRANTDSVQPAATSACRGRSNGAWARRASTWTATGTSPVGGGVAVTVGAAGVDGSDEHPAISATPSSVAPIRLCRRQTRMHLPDEDFGGFGGGDALTTGGGEPHGITFVQRPGAFERNLASRHEQVQIGRLGQLDGLTGLQAGAVQCRVLVADGDRTV